MTNPIYVCVLELISKQKRFVCTTKMYYNCGYNFNIISSYSPNIFLKLL
jgi:hypothetical protein